MSSSYQYQKRKPRNIARILALAKNGKKCGPGQGDTRHCYYPDEGKKCNPKEIDPATGKPKSGKCDARLYSKKNIGGMDKVGRIRYHLDRGRQSYGSAIAFRKKYSAYQMDQNDYILLDWNDQFGYIGNLKNGFAWNYKVGAKQDGYSPPNHEPVAIDASSEASRRWLQENGKRYHYQAEALLRNGKAGTLGGAGHLEAAWKLLDEFITSPIPEVYMDRLTSILSIDEMNVLFSYDDEKLTNGFINFSNLYYNPPNISPAAFYRYIYEPLLNFLPIGKQKGEPINDVDSTLKWFNAMLEKRGREVITNYISPQELGNVFHELGIQLPLK